MSAQKTQRVVVTGLGVIAPNAYGVADFTSALMHGISGIRKVEKLQELKFRCQVGGIPPVVDPLPSYLTAEDLMAMNEAMRYAALAAVDAWIDAGFDVPDRGSNTVHWDAGTVFGCGLSGMDTIGEILVPKINAGLVRRMGSAMVEQTMGSSVSAKLSGLLALGNQVTSNSSACNTGSEAIHDGYQKIRNGLASRMVVGGAESSSPYIWGGFDAMKVLNGDSNDSPELASRPMSASAGGFVPGSGAGALLLESLESATRRGARIYAELLGAAVNCGGHRMGGSMTAPNCVAVQRCIRQALSEAKIDPNEIDAINGHLTATMADPIEIGNWSAALERSPGKFPKVNSTKSLIGHCLGAAGAVESVACVVQLAKGFLHPSVNCEDVHPEIAPFTSSIVRTTTFEPVRTMAKASFGFGDVNSCLIFRRWE